MKDLFIKQVLLVFLYLITSASFSQERTVTGFVTALENIKVINAEVKVLSSGKIVLTDSVGSFKINCLLKDKIKISAKGFYSQKVKIKKETKKAFINLKFKSGKKNLDLAVGYGHVKERDRTFAMSNIVNNNQLDYTKYTNIIELIVNTSPSVEIRGGRLIIRGISTIRGSSEALIVIDGTQVNASQLSMISPHDVKSINILKDGSAAIYGAQGSNGVIIITTKRGKENN